MDLLVAQNGIEKKITADAAKTLLENLQQNDFFDLETPCGGKGTCKKCLVKVLSEDGSREVLACQTRAEGILKVILDDSKETLIAENGTCYLYPTDGKDGFGFAVDIGTTTVVGHLLDQKTGKRICTVSDTNAQRSYGADVISRIQACNEGKLVNLQQVIVSQVDKLLKKACQKAQIKTEEITFISVCGNTTMEHIFCGISPEGIGKAPFIPATYFGENYSSARLGFTNTKDLPTYLLPAIAGYVGGDITSDMIAVQMQRSEELILLLDIGTNGEMALGNANQIITCATAAGPAFEGAEISMGMPASEGAINKVWIEKKEDGDTIAFSTIGNEPAKGICGSGLIDALACFLQLEIMDETGCFADEDDLPEILASHLEKDDQGTCFFLDDAHTVKITQGDIRKLQLAKAAIAAGIQVLLEKMQVEESDVSSLILAGGFGSFLDPKSAAAIGLIPMSLLPRAKAVGNAAGEGAVSALLSEHARLDLAQLSTRVQYEELSTNKSFNEFYMDAMYFE